MSWLPKRKKGDDPWLPRTRNFLGHSHGHRSLAEGYLSAFDLAGRGANATESPLAIVGARIDRAAIASDWCAVGTDFATALGRAAPDVEEAREAATQSAT